MLLFFTDDDSETSVGDISSLFEEDELDEGQGSSKFHGAPKGALVLLHSYLERLPVPSGRERSCLIYA